MIQEGYDPRVVYTFKTVPTTDEVRDVVTPTEHGYTYANPQYDF